MRTLNGSLVVGIVLIVALLSSSCVFDSALEVTVFDADPEDGELTMFISTTSSVTICDSEGSGFYSCVYFPKPADEGIISTFTLTDIELALRLIILDPLVIQLPDAAHEFKGSYAHIGSGAGGALDIISGLESLQIDGNRALTAEPGTQLVVLALPEGAPTSGQFAFNFNFVVPDTLASVQMKPLFTGRVDTTAGESFYTPLLPCETDMASVPSVSVPVPAGGVISLPVTSAHGCDNEVYALAPTAQVLPLYLPVIIN